MSTRYLTRMRWLASLAALPLLGLPLRAAEPPQPAEAEAPAAPEEPAPEPAQQTPPAASGGQAPPKPVAPVEEEEVSLDNNLTFPVDI